MTELEKATHDVLKSSRKALSTDEIYKRLQKKVPELCNDDIVCQWCRHIKHPHPMWQHQVGWDLQHLKGKGLVKHVSDLGRYGLWSATK